MQSSLPRSTISFSFEAATVPELRRWLKCRNMVSYGKKSELIARCKLYGSDPSVSCEQEPDGGVFPHTESATPTTSSAVVSWTKSLSAIPKSFGEVKIYEHLGGRTEKHRVAGYNMYKCDKVENMLVRESDMFEVKSIVGASYSKTRYRVSIKLSNTGRINRGYCNCKAGSLGKCKHVAATLFKLNDFQQSKTKEIPESVACTEKPRQWGVKKKATIVSKKFSDLNFIKYAPGKEERNILNSERRREYCCIPPSKLHMPESRLQNFAESLKGHRKMWSEIVYESIGSSNDIDGSACRSLVGNQVMSPSSVKTALNENVFETCLNLEIQCKNYVDHQEKVSAEERALIEYETRGQSSNENWFHHRKGRVTASVVGQIVHQRKTTPPDAVVKKIMGYQNSLHMPHACRHGLEFESEARHHYVHYCSSQGLEVEVEERGLLIDEFRPWLGASVDGLVKVTKPDRDTGLLEIKCPYVCSEEQDIPINLVKLCESRNCFYLTSEGGTLSINEKHNYYFQVQAQLGISQMKWCDFMVSYKLDAHNISDTFISRINFNEELYNDILPKLDDFYCNGVVREIITGRVKMGQQLYPNSTNYKYTSGKEN